MRNLIAASLLSAFALSSTSALASSDADFMEFCTAKQNDTPLADPGKMAQTPVFEAILGGADARNCVAALNKAKELTTLDLSNKGVTDISMVASLTNLTSLNISKNNVQKLDAISGLTKLTTLDFSENKVSDLAPLKGLVALTDLNGAKNEIVDIEPLSGLVALTQLRLNDNQIDKVAAITEMKDLKKLYLSTNKIENLNPLAKNKKLVELAVRSNPVKQCPDGNKVEVKGKEIENTDLLKSTCKDEAWKAGGGK